MDVRILDGVGEAPEDAWNGLMGAENPFMSHGFLSALELAGCVGAGTGWQPRPLVVYDGARLVGAAASYVKAHSMGEFVYDWAWADAAARAGLPYYPKWVIACPFSPVGGRRLLVDPSLSPEGRVRVQRLLLETALEVSRDEGMAGVHMLFSLPEEVALAADMGFAHRVGMQCHWKNGGYTDFDDFLGRFRAKRRKTIKRERRSVRDMGIVVKTLMGDEIDDSHCEHAFRFYGETVDKFLYGRRYLNARFFELLWKGMKPRLQLTLATRDGEVLAGALGLSDRERVYGRYWGADSQVPFLHFEVCSYAPVEECIRRGLRVFEAGSGGAHHKYPRGFSPVLTHSAHMHFHRGFMAAIEDFCAREALAIQSEAEALEHRMFAR